MLNDAIDAELPFLRREAEARMQSRFDVAVPTGQKVYDEAEQADVEEMETLLVNQPGRVKVSARQVANPEAGGRSMTVVTRELHLPIGTPLVPNRAIATCVSVGPLDDQTLVGARLRVLGPTPGSQMTARRLQVEEVQS